MQLIHVLCPWPTDLSSVISSAWQSIRGLLFLAVKFLLK